MTSIFSKDVIFSSKCHEKMSFESESRIHICSYVFQSTLTKTDVFLKVRHSHKSPPKCTNYTWKDDFFKKRCLWRSSPFQKSYQFSHLMDAFWQNRPPFERWHLSYKTSIDLKLVRSGWIWNLSVKFLSEFCRILNSVGNYWQSDQNHVPMFCFFYFY